MKKRKRKTPDIFRIQIQAIDAEIKDALKNDDIKRLEGAQSFASSLWNWTNTGVMVFSYLIRRTIEKRKVKEKEEFSLAEIIGVTKNKVTTEFFLEGFKKSGYIEMDDNNPPGYKGEKDKVIISLNKSIWKNVLRRLENKGKEKEVFTQSIGSLLSLSALAREEGRPCGLRLYTAFASICNEAMNNNNEVSLDKCREIFSKEGRTVARFYNALSEDSQKVDNLRFISKNDGKKITISKNAINAHKRFVNRANKIVTKMYRK